MSPSNCQPTDDSESLVEVFAVHRNRLLRRVQLRIRLNPFADFSAEDVVQEAFADAHRGFGGLRSADPKVVEIWLNRITDNRLAQTIRDRNRVKRGGRVRRVTFSAHSAEELFQELEDGQAETGSTRFARMEIKAEIQRAVLKLPEQPRLLVEEYYLRQKTLDEIAEDHGMTKAAVRSLLYRAKQLIKVQLGNSSRWYSKK